MRVNLLVIDDFYSNVDEVRKFALSQKFLVEGNYPGFRTEPFLNESTKKQISYHLEPHAGKVLDWMDTSESQYT